MCDWWYMILWKSTIPWQSPPPLWHHQPPPPPINCHQDSSLTRQFSHGQYPWTTFPWAVPTQDISKLPLWESCLRGNGHWWGLSMVESVGGMGKLSGRNWWGGGRVVQLWNLINHWLILESSLWIPGKILRHNLGILCLNNVEILDSSKTVRYC